MEDGFFKLHGKKLALAGMVLATVLFLVGGEDDPGILAGIKETYGEQEIAPSQPDESSPRIAADDDPDDFSGWNEPETDFSTESEDGLIEQDGEVVEPDEDSDRQIASSSPMARPHGRNRGDDFASMLERAGSADGPVVTDGAAPPEPE